MPALAVIPTSAVRNRRAALVHYLAGIARDPRLGDPAVNDERVRARIADYDAELARRRNPNPNKRPA